MHAPAHPNASPRPICPVVHALPLHGGAASRALEQAALRRVPPFSLMARAGAEAARWLLAMAPHARRVWIAAGPGNNGGDGLVLARWLHQRGRQVWVSMNPPGPRTPDDARRAHAEALAAGVPLHAEAPPWAPDLVVDALLGLGQDREPQGWIAQQIEAMARHGAPVLALDLPTGLCADTGRRWGATAVRAQATLSLLTLKPGLFTGEGRDLAGDVWWSPLGVPIDTAPDALLQGLDALAPISGPRAHASHKGSHGDAWVVGGAPGMGGAARLAARAALQAGAGRVYLAALDPQAALSDEVQPELMHRPLSALDPQHLSQATVVCGCGGAEAVAAVLPLVLGSAHRLVLDADALNAVALDPGLRAALQARGARGLGTVITPHPLEAARLLGLTAGAVQADRQGCARRLADALGSVVVLKGSGTVVAAPGQVPRLNSTGNARLATAGSGDVLAGWLGGVWAGLGAPAGTDPLAVALQASCASVALHGLAADQACGRVLPASSLAAAMARALA